MSLFQNISFYTTVNQLKDLPRTCGVEVAFVGRSNAGKSSAINTLSRRGRLAFVSKTPGRTQHINFFQLGNGNFLVDLPGYGYAKVPFAIRQHWEHLLSSYLQTRDALYGMVLIMDVRHPLTKLDLQMLEWFSLTKKPVHILLTKSDKLSRNQAAYALKQVRHFLAERYPQCTAQLFSSMLASGVEEAITILADWFGSGSAMTQQNDIELGTKKTPVKGEKTGGNRLISKAPPQGGKARDE
ncbi:ribosome biogenesis GTP-binding protein YihA/YsxC [Nitrosomonas communis]|uniref:ribosome biogenesis GTP-binding protein YihA/YsxC n=1 Tax=Nitrosomonas communis TaxID=44574 RepID=UPI0026E9EB7D|nr:ribosome biogenesis GTP-binding protein YihA/YsxC [Nitrosomonas communis]MCO6428291.1 YihA family ribosome biogenesis GTP-binding protein [Nitrosomonas communis]